MAKMRLLFVDDENNVLRSFQRNLHFMKDRWEMTFVSSGMEALSSMSEAEFDIVISDYKMPEMNGLELLTKVREKFPGTKRVLLSGQSEASVFDEAQDIVNYYIAKPCNTDTLVSILQTL